VIVIEPLLTLYFFFLGDESTNGGFLKPTTMHSTNVNFSMLKEASPFQHAYIHVMSENIWNKLVI
jgi:hypothetical protein